MKRLLAASASLATALVLPSCLQNETTLHLKRDGSGTLVEQTTFSAQTLAMFEQMASFGGGDAKDPLAEMFSTEKAKSRAATLGEGVTLEKSVPVTVGGNKGASVSYHFTDVSKLKITPGATLRQISPGASSETVPEAKPITFTYADGTLVVTLPEPPAPPAGAKQETIGEQEKAMMSQMLGDLKMSFKIVAESGIAETDASLREGNSITLMSMDMAKVLEQPEAFDRLQSVDKRNPASAIEALKGVDGVKIETKRQVTLKVK